MIEWKKDEPSHFITCKKTLKTPDPMKKEMMHCINSHGMRNLKLP